MAFRFKREQRKQLLNSYGLLPFESQALSEIPLKHAPFLRQLISDRKKLLRQARKEKWSNEKYVKAVRNEYDAKDWVIKDTPQLRAKGTRLKSIGQADVWSMARFYRELYQQKNPQYESPSKGRRSHHNPAYDKLNTERIAEQKRQYRERNRDRIRTKASEYRRNRKERGY